MLKINFYPESDKKELIEATKEYQEIWNNEGEKIVTVIEKISGLKFKEKEINSLIFEGRSFFRPLQLRASRTKERKKAEIIHEICHRLLSGNRIDIKPNLGGNSLKDHMNLNLILFDIWVFLYGERFGHENARFESLLAPFYKQAWDWALSFTKEERARKFKELIEK